MIVSENSYSSKRGAAILRIFLIGILLSALLSIGSAQTAHAAKAREAYYKGTVKKGATLTSVSTEKTVKLKKATSVTVIQRGKKTYIIKYKNKKYKVAASKVTLGAMATNSSAFSKSSAQKFVNNRGYSSKTKYLVWVSLYSQHVYIFKGSKGKWKLVRSFLCSTGRTGYGTTYGKSQIYSKQAVWYWNGVPCAKYASRIAGGAIHSWSSGGLGSPASHGCVRCSISDAYYVYKKVPVNTTVYTL